MRIRYLMIMLLLGILTFSHCSSYVDKKEVKDVLEALEKLKASAETAGDVADHWGNEELVRAEWRYAGRILEHVYD